jgi:hypothetical protein
MGLHGFARALRIMGFNGSQHFNVLGQGSSPRRR